jgi:hypothetical protein
MSIFFTLWMIEAIEGEAFWCWDSKNKDNFGFRPPLGKRVMSI